MSLHPFYEMAFIVAGKYDQTLIKWPRPDGNPFPYERKIDAQRRVAQLNKQKKAWSPLKITIVDDNGVQSEVLINHPNAIRFGVYDWITEREIV